MEKYTNALIHETSPYLLQHAHNPVNWVAWSNEAFEEAKRENKLVLISVGYSACHWCHVMEHESFEDEEVAALMNKFFVCIKVDREERPDVDQVYMTAVQLMTQRGGWPLNCFTLPDGKPVYGGTYFPKEQWMQILRSLEHTYRNKPEEVIDYANKLQEGVQQSEWIQSPEPKQAFHKEKLDELVLRWSHQFDQREGGSSRAPKFPLPSNYEFLLRYAVSEENPKIMQHVWLTLDKMALGGIYDQVGGGFARYSVDVLWKIPHFEKMLYDNGQLLSLYAKAYQVKPNETYKRIVYQTTRWMERELLNEYGAFYSALDADSEGEEGKFYVWKKEELTETLGEHFAFAESVFEINGKGFWEEGNYVLMRQDNDEAAAKRLGMEPDLFQEKLAQLHQLLSDERSHRTRPGLDDKSLTSWNAIAMKGLVDAYFAFGDEWFLHLAQKNARWLLKYQTKEDGSLYRSFKLGTSSISGFLEDYAHAIAAFIRLYEATFDIQYLNQAQTWTEFALTHFIDSQSLMFYFTPNDTELIARKMEINDNVIPSSNSVMANNLILLAKLTDKQSYLETAEQMLANVYDGMEQYGSGYSHWGLALMHLTHPFAEVVITGPDWKKQVQELGKKYLPNIVIAGGMEENLPLLQNRTDAEKTRIFVCVDQSCLAPVSSVEDAWKELKRIM